MGKIQPDKIETDKMDNINELENWIKIERKHSLTHLQHASPQDSASQCSIIYLDDWRQKANEPELKAVEYFNEDKLYCSGGTIEDRCNDYRPFSEWSVKEISEPRNEGTYGVPEPKTHYTINITLDGLYRVEEIINFVERKTGKKPMSAPRTYTNFKRKIGKVTLIYEIEKSVYHVNIPDVSLEKNKISPHVRF
ncbi:MAG: hypothetical protein ABH824_00890 [Nanoarchaeota archaeon]|nr:hypothetical protein [Nanoarchaeota archaeon]MBU1632739.1 hypothetical protein [Nanoarchaeota archaeon]MBU1876655.1 hypothetical protein [Nanoarchaeota archaeon]